MLDRVGGLKPACEEQPAFRYDGHTTSVLGFCIRKKSISHKSKLTAGLYIVGRVWKPAQALKDGRYVLKMPFKFE